MIWRLLHIVVLGALVLAAADVYKIKYESTLQAERVAKLRGEVRREQDTIAQLRAEWSRLDRPDRIQELAQRHLTLKPLEVRQYDTLDRLPERPVELVPPGTDRSDRRHHRDAGRSRCVDRQPARRGGAQTAMTETIPVADTPETVAMAHPAPVEPLRRRILRALLYGKADRHAKARARIGLAIIAFTAIYGVIAGRLVLYAVAPDSHGARPRQRGRCGRDRAP